MISSPACVAHRFTELASDGSIIQRCEQQDNNEEPCWHLQSCIGDLLANDCATWATVLAFIKSCLGMERKACLNVLQTVASELAADADTRIVDEDPLIAASKDITQISRILVGKRKLDMDEDQRHDIMVTAAKDKVSKSGYNMIRTNQVDCSKSNAGHWMQKKSLNTWQQGVSITKVPRSFIRLRMDRV